MRILRKAPYCREKNSVAPWAFGSLVFSSTAIATLQLLAAALIARGKPTSVLLSWALTASASITILVWSGAGAITTAVAALILAPLFGIAVAATSVLRESPRHGRDLSDGHPR